MVLTPPGLPAEWPVMKWIRSGPWVRVILSEPGPSAKLRRLAHERSERASWRIKWLEYRFGIARSECRAYMPSVWRHGSVANSESRWKRSVAATVSIKFSWMAKPSSMADAGSLLV